jgi:RNA polymerase sigma-70 factor (ECF subfamily)
MSLPREQFESLAIAELDSLYRMARRLTHNPTVAEDLVQETFTRALAGREGFDLLTFGMKPWLLRILYNLHLNRVAREKRMPMSMSESDLDASNHYRNGNSSPLDPASFEAMDEEVVKALDRLHPDYRIIMLLWAVEELSYKEIAATLDIPMGTVMSRLHRARSRLADLLQSFANRQRLIRE